MNSVHPLMLPVFAMVLIVIVVWLRMYFERFTQMTRERIHPQAVATRQGAIDRLKDSRAADNFQNLFELPVLFYALVAISIAVGINDAYLQALAWGFVALRFAHSGVHLSYNKVMHRFALYVLSSLMLWAMWVRFGFLLWVAH